MGWMGWRKSKHGFTAMFATAEKQQIFLIILQKCTKIHYIQIVKNTIFSSNSEEDFSFS